MVRRFLVSLLMIPIGLVALQAADRPPNILIIVGDDMGYADVGFHQCKDIPTPHLDGLAASGVRFSNGYVTGPYCSPTRAGLLTGRYQTRFGHEFNPGDAQGESGLPLSQSTLADRLKANGYQTALVGKWHLGSQPSMQPQQRGFDQFFGFLGGAHSYFSAKGILRGTEPVSELDYTTDAFGREAAKFIRQQAAQPWFLCLTFNAVHTPMDATDSRLARFASIADKQRRTYAAMMSAMDDAIGVVLEQLRESKQEQNTLIGFISDNGGPTMQGVTVNGSVNRPLRGSKRTTLEGGVRVPFLLAWPGHIQPAVYEKPVIQLDLHATALAAAGIEAKSDWKLDGVNLIPYLNGTKQDSPHQALYWRFGQQMAIRQGDFKLVRYDQAADTGAEKAGVVSDVKLYNLREDIGESKDLAAAMPEKVKELQAAWDTWNASNVEPLWGGAKKGAGKGAGKAAANRRNREKAEQN